MTNRFNYFSCSRNMTGIMKNTNDMVLFQRIDGEYIKESFHSLRSIKTKLNTFMHSITDVFRTAFQRMHLALNNLMAFLVLEDFQLMQQILHDCLNVYASRYGMVVDRTQLVIGEMMGMLPATINESHQLQRYIPERIMKASSAVLAASFQTQWSLDANHLDTLIDNIPRRLVSDRWRLRDCQTFQTNITNLLQNPFSHYDMKELYTLLKKHTSNRCVSELPSKLESSVHVIDDISSEIRQVFRIENAFDNAAYLETETDYLNNIQATAEWLSDQLIAYSENRTTQIKLSTELTQSTLSDIQHNLDRIAFAVDRDTINPLLSRSNIMLRNVKRWYARALCTIAGLVPFYDHSGIEESMRALKIWRHPMARLQTADILQFKYPASESWRTWELSSTLKDFAVSGNATTTISTVINEYIEIIESTLLQIRTEVAHKRNQVIQTFKDVIDDFTNVGVESSMGSNFVMWVWQLNGFALLSL